MFDLDALAQALAAQGRVARVVIAAVEGSSPREVGAAMLVWADGQAGTIGGGALEYEAAARARAMLDGGPTPARAEHRHLWTGRAGRDGRAIGERSSTRSQGGEGWPAAGGGAADDGGPPLPPEGSRVDRVALGPSLGQCCGGAVVLWTEVFAALPEVVAGVVARGPGVMPLAVKRVLAAARGQGVRPVPGLVQGWMVEPVAEAERQVWVWGAGHVGRALVAVLAPLPGVAVTWVDVLADRFPDAVPAGVTVVPAADPAVLADHAPVGAEHLIVTFSHALDLELCHRLLHRGFRSCGLIGSASKWARFRARLRVLGHGAEAVGRIACPMGDPALGKHPQAIAIGVAAALLRSPVHGLSEARA